MIDLNSLTLYKNKISSYVDDLMPLPSPKDVLILNDELIDNYTGNGIIHEILIEILRFGFSDLKLNRIYAIARAENNASINILKHYNFNYVGETIETLKSNSGIQNIKYETYDIYAKQYLKKSKKFIKK